jgi:hypothetical protein
MFFSTSPHHRDARTRLAGLKRAIWTEWATTLLPKYVGPSRRTIYSHVRPKYDGRCLLAARQVDATHCWWVHFSIYQDTFKTPSLGIELFPPLTVVAHPVMLNNIA